MKVDRWYYTQQGQTFGPVSKDQIKHLGSMGSIIPTDLVWPEGVDCQMRFADWQAIDSPISTEASSAGPTTALKRKLPLPDWLGDVRKAEQTAGPSLPLEKISVTEWLKDLRRFEEP